MTPSRSTVAAHPAPTIPGATRVLLIDERKQERALTDINQLLVEIHNPDAPTAAEVSQLRQVLDRNNFVLYQYGDPGAAGYQQLCAALGLRRRIGNPAADPQQVSRITAAADASAGRYIPYTRHALKWHTDGYYNEDADRVGAFVLHCERAAAEGGGSQFLDPELLYLMLRERDPRLVEALSEADVFTVPANVVDGRTIRESFTGPVFDVDANAHLAMRYSERSRHLYWRDDDLITRAREAIHSILTGDCEWIVSHTLAPGQGVIANNVLHRRDAFEDSDNPAANRCLHRIRFNDRIATTS